MSKTWQEPKNSKTGQCPRIAAKGGKHSAKAQDLFHIAVLVILALGVGIYIISTTVLISRDGVYYIERAQNLSNDPVGVIKAHPPGYPFLIRAAHELVMLFNNSSSVFTWIYSAQSVTLLCRLLALIPLYFIGKLLVGGKNSFWAILVLVLLPHSAKYCAEIVRVWPYILFLVTGFFFLLWGAKYGKWWAFGLVGLISGLGCLIRYESAQLVIYGLLWVAMSLCRPKLWGVVRWKILIGLALLLVGFAISVVPYMKCIGRIIPSEVNSIMKAFSFNTLPDKPDVPKVNRVSSNYNTAELVPGNVLKALGEIFNTIGENLMWFFMLPLAIGFWYRLRRSTKFEEKFLITAFVLLNLTIMVLQYCCRSHSISRRWSLPLIVLTIFYVPTGLQISGAWLSSRFFRRQGQNEENPQFWFFVLLVVGVAICLPKLLRPMGIKKEGYRDAARWLRENTAPTDVIAVPDRRIAFYVERKGLIYDKKIPEQVKYVVRIERDKDEELKFGIEVREKYSVWVDKREKKKRIIIYEVL